MTDPNGSNGSALKLFWGDKGVSVKGVAVIVFLMWLAIVASNLYSGYRLEQAFTGVTVAMGGQHRELATASDRTACAVSLSPAERERFRQEYRPGAWSLWCPWIKE